MARKVNPEKPPKLFAGKYHSRTYSAHLGEKKKKKNNKTKEKIGIILMKIVYTLKMKT